MRDEPPRVGRPRKGTQRKSKERYKAANIPGAFQLDDDVDFQAPSESRSSRRIASPVNVLTSPTSISSTAMSMDSASSDINPYEENDSSHASQDDLCALCNCGSEMAQILGQITRYYPSPGFDPFKCEEESRASHSRDSNIDRFHEKPKDSMDTFTAAPLKSEKRSVGRPPGKKKKRGRHPLIKHQHLTADMSTFGSATRPEISDVFDSDGCIWAHHCCAAWSAGVCQTDSYDLENVDKAAYKAISEQCCHCRRHGASVECQIQKCSKLYHYPCCASAGAFQDIKSMVLLCPDHLDHALRLAGSEATCVLCDKAGDISKQLFCTSCGRHYHGKCLDPPVAISSIVRMGWQCPECKVCQGCRQPGDDEKMLFCDECDKGFHTYCLSPPMSSVPKTAWKCYRCRKCEDCGSNVPGSGPSCRWHFNYTVCDRCYQQRKKNTLQCCPMCGKAVRNSSGELIKQCMKCAKFIHARCDKDLSIDIGEYYCPHCRKDFQDDDSEFSNFMDHKEESNDSLLLSPVHSSTNDLDAEYLGQRTVTIAEAEAISRTATGFLHREPSPLLKQNEMEDLDLKGMDINFDEVMMESGLHGPLIHDLDELKPDSSDSFSSPPHISSSASYSHQFSSSDDRQNLSRVSSSATSRAGRGKKKMSPFRCRGRPPGSGRGKKNKNARVGRPRSKSTTNTGPNKENIQTGVVATADINKKDEADDDAEGLHSTVIMVSTKDTFSLGQDICMCCGSFGKGSEGHLIACAHCGQCFHPYCVNIKINKVLMTKGWRCLDCTVCEGCGKNEDEGKLLLCDGCDISYHIYCLEPPLDEVPPDGWKCQWCVECTSCGSTTPGTGCKWMSSYTQCGPCASEVACCVCNKTYLDDELVIKCTHCSRWLHADCDGLASEDDSELAASYGYHCCLCREKTGHFGIFSTSWTKIIERGAYTGPNKLTTQTVIVTQTTTTVMATGVSSRKSKSLSNANPDLVSMTKQGVRPPLHPVQTSVQGTFEVKLPGLRMKSRRNEIIESDSVSLTEKGLKEIKSMIVKAPHRSHARAKDRAMKLSGTDVRLGERETKTSGQLTKTTACSEDIGESRQPVCLATGSTETEEYHVESETESKPVQEKRMPGRPPNDRKHEKKLPHDKRDDPIDFFGTSLLKLSRKKRKKDPQTDNDTQSSEDELNKKENTSVTNAQEPRNQPGHLSGVASYSELSEQQGTATTVSQHGSWPSKISAGMTVDPLSDEMQHSDSLYKTLNMLVSGPEDVESQPGRELQHDQHQTQTKTQQHYASSKQHSAARHGAHSTLNEHNSSMTQNTDLTPTGDLDLIGLSDLPHVEGHEVEEIFAGIEREMSVDGTPRSQDQSPMETSLNEFPKSESSNFNREQLKKVKKKEGQFQGQGTLKSATPVPDPSSFPDAQQRVQLSQQDYRQFEMYRNNPSFQAPYEQRPGQPKPLGGHSGETDAFKAVFGEEPEIRSKSRDGASSPKIDGQKQLRKWEQDEKLGELATISPVLYANIVHNKLKIDYPEWPNRARAIARLWRKLPQEQREPFRLRARDNRVKQKDQGRKLANFKKPSSTPTTDSNMAFSNPSPSLSSDNSDKSMVQSTAETTAIDVLSNNLMLNGGESSNTGLIRTQMYQQNVSHSFTQKQESQFPETSPGYSHESNHSFGTDDHSVFRQNHGQFMTGAGDEHMHDPMLLQTRSSSVVSPSITSLQKSHQSLARTSGRVPSDTNSKTFSLSDLCSPSTPSEMHFPAPGLTPTTPVFPTSPFQTIPYGTDTAGSPAGFISPSLPMEGSTVEKKKPKKPSKISKEQLEVEKEKKKKKLAVEQEKERQWKALQQQRLKEQQAYQQTPAIQQVLMMKEQMRKENNKPNRKSQINMGLDHDDAVLRSNILPPVEPFSLTSNSRSIEDKNKPTSMSKEHIVAGSTANNPVAREQSDIPIQSPFAGHMDYFKDDINIPTDQESIDKALFLTKDSESHGEAVKISADSHTSASSLDRLLEISNSEFAKIAERPDLDDGNKSNASSHVVVSIASSTVQQWVTSADISSYTTSPSYPMQHNTDQRNPTDPMIEFQQNKDRASADTVILHRQHSLPMTLPEQQVRLSDIPGQSESQLPPTGKTNQPAKASFNMAAGQVLPPVPVNIPENLEKPTGIEQQQQQQALLFQQQQFMAAQQQYIQWQLQQRNPELFQSVTAPVQYSSYSDKDLPEVDSEEQHQERIRFLYRQRQMQKQQVVQIQQQLQQHQLISQQQVTPGSTTNPARPQVDAAQQQFMQQLLQQQQQVPEAVQQQFLVEYNRQMQQRAETGQNVMQYDKFMAELAQQYGYTMQSSNAHPVSVMQPGMTWQGATPQGVNPSAQQMFGYGIDEEKAKDLTPQQLYQLQLQHTLMMHQMAATGMYQPTTSRNQSPIPAGSRKGPTGSNQDRSKKSKKGTSQEKSLKPETQQGAEQKQEGSKQNIVSSKSGDMEQLQNTRETESMQGSPSVKQFDSKTLTSQERASSSAQIGSGSPMVERQILLQESNPQSLSRESPILAGSISSSISSNDLASRTPLGRGETDSNAGKDVVTLTSNLHPALPKSLISQNETISNEINEVRSSALKQTFLSRPDVVNNILDNKNIHGFPNIKATEKNTDAQARDSHQSVLTSKSKDHETEKSTQKVICNDGIHCGTDSEDESYPSERDTFLTKKASDLIKEGNTVKDTGRSIIVPKAVCSDGIHCGTDSEDEERETGIPKGNVKPICSDGIHCGTDSEDDERETGVPKGNIKSVCSDGIHCGTDSEDDERETGVPKGNVKSVCSDGIHCGTDSEDDERETGIPKGNVKSVCSDGIHCGTDSEDEGCRTKTFPLSKVKSVCSDGIHCGTDSEDENQTVELKQKVKKVCSDGIHCGTDSEDEGIDAKKSKSGLSSNVHGARNARNKQDTCSDGIHCGTDSEDENENDPNLKSQKHQSASNKASDKGRSTGQSVVCSDGIHCGTDSENEDDKANSSKEAKDPQEKPSGPSQDSSGNQSQITPQPGQISTSTPGTSGSIFSPAHTLEVIQEGDVMVNSLGALGISLRGAKNDAKLSGSVDNDFGLSSHGGSLISTAQSKETPTVKDEQKSVSSCAVGQQQHPAMHQNFVDQIKKSNPTLISAVSGAQIIQAPLPNDLQHSLAEKTPVISTSKMQQIEPQAHQQRDNTHPQQQMFSPPPSTPTAMQQDPQSRQRPKFSGIPPMSPQYQKVFLHQHQLLIMQFQQYQYQLQAQFQQLSQQQMSPQQQFLLQQQYHQQIVLLQRQFVQQQAQLQAMASAGMQFTEQELNFMYQQQMVAQQAYNHWIATLSLDQQGQLHARMQANMQQVQQAMAATMQTAAKSASEPVKEKVKKPRGRRPRKNKTEPTDPATPAPNTPSLPPTPASGGDAALPSTPNKDQAATPDLVQRNRNQRSIYPPDTHSFAGSNAVGQGSQMPPDFMNDKRQIQPNQQGQQGIQYASGPIQPSLPGQMQSVDQQSYPVENVQNLPPYHQSQGNINQQLMQMQGREWQQLGSDARHPSQQHQPDNSMQQQNKSITEQIPNSQHSNLPRVHIIPGGSNPFSDVYREMEKKIKVPSQMNTPTMDPKTGAAFQGTQNYTQEQWKSMQAEDFHQPGSGNSTPRIPSTSMHSESVFYYPSPSGNPPSVPQQPHSSAAYTAKSRGLVSASLPQGTPDGQRMYPEQPSSQAQYFDQGRDHLHQDSQNSSLTDLGSLNQSQTTGQNVTQYPTHSTMISQMDNTAVQPVYDSHGQRSNLAMEGVTDSNWAVPMNEQSFMHATQGRQLSTPRLQNVPGGNTEIDAAQAQHLQTTNSQNVLADDRLMPPPPKYENTTDKGELPPYSVTMSQQINKLDGEQEIANRLNNIGSVESKEQPKALQKRKRGGQTAQLATASVDFSLLNPEEQKKFILERKREDFERRKRIVEDQKQQKIKDQRNFKTAGRKIDKKLPRTKQQRKLKGGRDKLPTDKSPLPSRLILDDKSLKLPLCEPEVRLLYPLVQPYGGGYTNGETLLFGVFGSARVQGTNDYYSQFPSPDPPVTSSNPPTPPASLPPSPGTINQSLRDSLQMIPTEGIFDDFAMVKRPKDDLTLFGADLDRQNTSSFYSPVEHPSSSAGPHSKDDVMVTLTMSNDRNQTPNDRVSNVADILGVVKPNRIKIKEESRTDSGLNEPDLDSADPRPLATSIGKEKDVHFSCLESENSSNDPEKNKAPFCKHCDISIQGSGYIECKDADESGLIKVDHLSYKKIAINSGQELFDVFCSQMCLRSFHSLSKPLPGALRNDPTNTDDSGQLIDPVRSVIPVSTGDPSSIDFTRTSPEDIEMRGAEQAEGILPRIPRRRSLKEDGLERETKRPRCVIWKRWRIEFSPKPGRKESVKTSIIELLERYGAALKVDGSTKDERECMLCGDQGDGVTEGTARLINYDVDVWVHLNCALWSLEVYETLNGALHNVQKAYERGIQTACVYCGRKGATVTCARVIGAQMRRCDMNYHFNCAIKAHCIFFKDKTVLCPQHKNYGSVDQRLPSYAVLRKVYVNRDITKQLASVLRLNNEKEQKVYTIRVGSLIFHELGQLLPHQLQKFHTKEAIYPIGFQTTRIYWSSSRLGRRCRYLCTVGEQDNNPRFTVTVEDSESKVGQYAGSTPKECWSCILEPVRKLRQEARMVKIFPEFMTGEDLFGLTDPSLQRIIESLPGVDTFHDYSFRFGRTPMIMAELPLAVNPTGCIRSESTRHVHLNRPVSLRTASSPPSERGDRADSSVDDNSQGSMLRNNWAMTKTAQYRKLKSDWKNIVLLSKSRIQGLGLFATRDIEPNTMIIEYIGSLIRNEVANKRERIYEDSNRGIYMFRVDSDTVIDATMTGGPARYINHSCDPNCVAEVVVIEKMPKIIIISNRKIDQGEELTYDYKFEFEDDQHKIACLCGAANCRKWMN